MSPLPHRHIKKCIVLGGNHGRFTDLYAIEPDSSRWSAPQNYDVNFNWDYGDGRSYVDSVIRRAEALEPA